MKELKLVLKKKWYDMIASGVKKEEYRDATKYWENRLLKKGKWESKDFECVTFYLGYSKDRPSISFKLLAIGYGKGKPEWGAAPDKEYFIIHLGEEITL